MSGFANHWLKMLDKLSERDRMAVLAALMAVVFGLDMMVVMPMDTQRKAIEAGMAATAQSTQQTADDATQQQQAQASELALRKTKIDQELAALGLNNALKDSLSFMLSRTLKNQAVKIQSLNALTVDQLTIDKPADTAEAEAVAVADPASAAEDSNSHPPLYRHRYEVKLQGELKSIGPTLDALEHDSHPLRIEGVRMQALPSGAIELTVMLVTIGLEKTWLAL